MSLNHVALYGRVSRDATVRYTSSNKPVASWGFCVDDGYRNPKTGQWETIPNFFDCVMFGDSAQNYAPKIIKGMPFIIEGRLHWNKWQDPKSGKNLSKVEIVVTNIVFTAASIIKAYDDNEINVVHETELADEDFVF